LVLDFEPCVEAYSQHFTENKRGIKPDPSSPTPSLQAYSTVALKSETAVRLLN